MAHRTGILAWYDCHISTGKVEGINNKIKVMKRTAYGFRDEHYFKLRLYALHDCPYHSKCRMNPKYYAHLLQINRNKSLQQVSVKVTLYDFQTFLL